MKPRFLARLARAPPPSSESEVEALRGTRRERARARSAIMFAAFAAFARKRLPPVPSQAAVDAAISSARARAFAEVILLILAGFILDDLRALRVPGFAVGSALAVVWLAFGSTMHAYKTAATFAFLEPAARASRLKFTATVNRGAVVGASILFATWLATTSGGVNLWPA